MIRNLIWAPIFALALASCTAGREAATSREVVDRATKHDETRTGRVHALEGYSMAVAEGELVCVLGPLRLRKADPALGHGRAARPERWRWSSAPFVV